MQKHILQSTVIYRNMFVCLYGCLLQSLPLPTCLLICICCLDVWFVWLVDVLWVLLCVWYLCVVYVKSIINVHTKEYNYFDILVGDGGDLKFDQVSFLDYFN